MSDVNTETLGSKTFNAEAFAMNIAKAMETSGQALAAYLKPREDGEPKDKPPSEIGEVVQTFTKVAEYWLTDTQRAVGAGTGEERRRRRSAHAQEGRILRSADHQRDRAVEFLSHQSGSAARDAGHERRQPRSRHEDAGRGYRSRTRHAAHPPVRP